MEQLSLLSIQEYATPNALVLPETLTRERWEALGVELKHIDSAVQWWVGDWWAFGEREYGTGQKLCVRLGWNYNTVTNWATIARTYSFSLRREKLSHSHHKEAAPLEEPDRTNILAWADETGASVSELRSAIKLLRMQATPPPPDDTFATLVVDPPWEITKIAREVRPNQQEMDYSMLSIADIIALNCGAWAHEDAHLYLWTTHKYLPDAFAIAEAWGFQYQCLMTWVKNVGMTPFSWMYSTEHVLFCTRGALALEVKGRRLDFAAKVQGHSRKPDEFYALVKTVSPGPRLDIFSRETHEGFDAWGAEKGVLDANV